MERKVTAGVVGGVVAGLVFAIVVRVIPGANGSMITFAARSVHLARPIVGWLAYVVYGGVLGVAWNILARRTALREQSDTTHVSGRRVA